MEANTMSTNVFCGVKVDRAIRASLESPDSRVSRHSSASCTLYKYSFQTYNVQVAPAECRAVHAHHALRSL